MAVSQDQAFATDLQTKVAQAGNTSAIVAFSAVVGGDIKLAATGPGAGIGGGGESQTGGGGNLINGFPFPRRSASSPASAIFPTAFQRRASAPAAPD